MTRTVLGAVVLGGAPAGASTGGGGTTPHRLTITGTVSLNTPPPVPSFTYGTTMPFNTGANPNVGVQSGVVLIPVSSFDPTTASNTTFTAIQFNCHLNLSGVSNAKFINCAFPGPPTGTGAFVEPSIIKTRGAGGVVKGDNTDVVGRWGKQGQNYFLFCSFGGATKPGGSQLLFQACIEGGAYYLDRCDVWGGIDNLDTWWNGHQNLYAEARGCWLGQLDGRYPDLSGQHDADGTYQTHNDSVQTTSGSFLYFLGCYFDGRMNPTSKSHPNYLIKNETGPGTPPVSISLPNASLAFYQQTANGGTGVVSDVEVDQNWLHANVCSIGFAQTSANPMKRIKITNNRHYYDGVNYSLATVHSWGGKYVHGYQTFHNWFCNIADPSNAATLADPSNDFSGNVSLVNGKTILYNYDTAPV